MDTLAGALKVGDTATTVKIQNMNVCTKHTVEFLVRMVPKMFPISSYIQSLSPQLMELEILEGMVLLEETGHWHGL